VIDFGAEVAFFLVDRLLGSNDEPAIEDRTLTVLERMVVRIAADQVSAQLMTIWKDRVAFKLSLDRFESEPELLRTANREDPMLVARIDVKAGKVESVMAVCMPLTVLEDFLTAGGSKHQIGRGTAEERSIDRSAVETALRQANVEVTVRSPAFGMFLNDLNRVRPGCVMRTGLAPNANLTLRVEGMARFIGQAGRADRALAVRIIATDARETDERADTNGRPRIMGSMVEPGTTELGRTRMAVQDVLELGRGSVVVLDRLVGEPVDVIVGDRPFAEGEVVVIGEQFGVRITRIVSNAKNGTEQK
jgi:flagellar motor switch protein FliN